MDQNRMALTELTVLFHVQLNDTIGDGGSSWDLQHHARVLDHVAILSG